MDKIRVVVTGNGQRLDKFLALQIPDLSRSRIKDLIEKRCVQIDQREVENPSYKVKEGESIEVSLPPLEDPTPVPQEIPLDILYEDEDLIVINKPAGLVVHPAPGNTQGTLVNALLSHCGGSLSGIGGVKRPGIVHRLDKETSGVMVAAKNDKAHHALSHQLATREMKRTYVALVWGMLVPKEGVIEGAIGRDRHHRQRMTIREGGKFARTQYKVLKYFQRIVSLVECHLDTGRTHQIRVHLKSQGHPLIGDIVYGKQPKVVPSPLKAYLGQNWVQGRHALHAKSLSFQHPRTEEVLNFETDLPEDMRKLIDMLNLCLSSI